MLVTTMMIEFKNNNNDNKDHIYHISMTWIMVSDDVENLFGSLISKVWANLLSLVNCYVLSMACRRFSRTLGKTHPKNTPTLFFEKSITHVVRFFNGTI